VKPAAATESERAELTDERDVDLGELRLKRAVEMRRVRRAVRQHRLAVDDEPSRTVDVLQQLRERRTGRLHGGLGASGGCADDDEYTHKCRARDHRALRGEWFRCSTRHRVERVS
jgi:hypothetical protein